MTLGERIRFRREQLNMTQEQLGDIVGVRVATISRYESGTIATPAKDKLASIMVALKVDASYLLDEDTNTTISVDEVKEQLRQKPAMRTLFKAASNVPETDLFKFAEMLGVWSDGRSDGEDI